MKGRNICVQQKGLHSSDLPCPALPGCSALHGEGQFISPLKKRLVKGQCKASKFIRFINTVKLGIKNNFGHPIFGS